MAPTVDPSVVDLVSQRWPGQRGALILALYRSHVRRPWDGVMPHLLIEGWFLGGMLPRGMQRLKAPELPNETRARLFALHAVAQQGDEKAAPVAAALVNTLLWTALFPEEFVHFSLDVGGIFAFDPAQAAAFVAASVARDHPARLLAFDLNALDSYRIATNRL